MPHVLWELQGYRTLDEADLQHAAYSFETIVPGKLTQSEYEELTRDLVSFLVYVGSPPFSSLQNRILNTFLGLLFILLILLRRNLEGCQLTWLALLIDGL